MWTVEDKLRLYRKYLEQGPQWTAIAEEVGSTEDACRNVFRRTDWDAFLEAEGLDRGELVMECKFGKGKSPDCPETLINERKSKILRDSEIRKLNDRIGKIATNEVIYDKIIAAIEAVPPIKVSDVKFPKAKAAVGPQEAVLLIGDVHIGLAVRPEEVGDAAEYSVPIFRRRLKNLMESVIQITRLHRTNHRLDTIHVCFLGDLVHGQNEAGQWGFLHQEQTILDQVFEAVREFQIMLVTLAGVYKKVNVYGVIGNHGRCLDTKTKILTPTGYKLYSDIRVGDLVGTMNMETESFEFQPVRKRHVFKNSEVLRSKTSHFQMCVTPDHDVLVRRRKTNNLAKIKGSQALALRDPLAIPNSFMSGNQDLASVSDDLLWLCGMLMTDGGFAPNCNTARIYQSKPKWIREIKKRLNRLGIPYSVTTRDREPPSAILGVSVKTARPSVEFCLKCSEGEIVHKIRELLPEREEIPEWMYSLSDRQVSMLLQGVMAGDGSARVRVNKTEKVVWGKRRFLEQLAGLLSSHGVGCALRKHKRSLLKRRVDGSVQQSFYLSILNFKNHTVHGRALERGVEKTVWCVTVDNGTIAVLSPGGETFFTGNCGRKGTEKAYVNWDYLIYKWMQGSLSAQPNIEFEIPKANFQIVNVMGKKLLLTHGDQAKAVLGIPYYGLSRLEGRFRGLIDRGKTRKRLQEHCAMRGIEAKTPQEAAELTFDFMKNIDMMACGHFHNMGEVETASGGQIILNSSFMGGDDFSIGRLAAAGTPQQKFFGVNHDHRTWSYDILLEK